MERESWGGGLFWERRGWAGSGASQGGGQTLELAKRLNPKAVKNDCTSYTYEPLGTILTWN